MQKMVQKGSTTANFNPDDGFYVPGREMFILVGTIGMGIIYGFLIELFTTIISKARAK